MTTLRIVLVDPERRDLIPRYATPGDAGLDLCAAELAVIAPGTWQLVRTGIRVEIPGGFVGLVHPRSGLAARSGITVLNAPGTIDAGYRGEIQVILYNAGAEACTLLPGDRIAQLVIQRFETVDIDIVDDLTQTQRGSGGFGSTGTGAHS